METEPLPEELVGEILIDDFDESCDDLVCGIETDDQLQESLPILNDSAAGININSNLLCPRDDPPEFERHKRKKGQRGRDNPDTKRQPRTCTTCHRRDCEAAKPGRPKGGGSWKCSYIF